MAATTRPTKEEAAVSVNGFDWAVPLKRYTNSLRNEGRPWKSCSIVLTVCAARKKRRRGMTRWAFMQTLLGFAVTVAQPYNSFWVAILVGGTKKYAESGTPALSQGQKLYPRCCGRRHPALSFVVVTMQSYVSYYYTSKLSRITYILLCARKKLEQKPLKYAKEIIHLLVMSACNKNAKD